MAKHGKKYDAAEKQVPAEAVSPLAAMKLLKEISTANFDETVTADFPSVSALTLVRPTSSCAAR